MKKTYESINNMTLDNLINLRSYVDELILQKRKEESWNGKIQISELSIDYELKKRLLELNITNMAEYVHAVDNGLEFYGDMKEKSDFALRMFNFDKIQRKYENRHK